MLRRSVFLFVGRAWEEDRQSGEAIAALQKRQNQRARVSGGGFGAAWELEVLGGLSDDLAEVVAESGVGEFDGYEVGEGELLLFLYGPDADELFEPVSPLLLRQPWPGGAVAVKRYGPPGAAEVRVAVGTDAGPFDGN